MTAPDQCCTNVRKLLSIRRRPHMTHSGHPGRICGTGFDGIQGHSGLMFAARITWRHFSVSSAMSLPKSAGEPARMRSPRSSYFALISDRARDALISLLSTSTISGEILGPGNAEPAFKCVIWQVLGYGRYIGQSRQAGRGGHCQGTDLAAPDLWNRIGRGCKLHVHLTADNIRQGQCDATIWHVNHVDAGHRLEEFSRQMTDRADAL